MSLSSNLPSIDKIAQIMGGDVTGSEALVPGPGHSAEDRSLAIKLDNTVPDGFVVHSSADDDPIVCRDHVRKKLGLPKFEAKKKASGSSGKNKKGNGGAKPWSPVAATYVYRKADGAPLNAALLERFPNAFDEHQQQGRAGLA
jgi:hypothetical protein